MPIIDRDPRRVPGPGVRRQRATAPFGKNIRHKGVVAEEVATRDAAADRKTDRNRSHR
jgi:hypothetical protein